MFIKSLAIYNNDGIIREIPFHKGLNLIVDNTPNVTTTTGNNVGKTTVLKLIDFCLGKDGRIIYSDPATPKVEHLDVKNFLINTNVIIELTLTTDFERRDVIIRRNFKKRTGVLREINGINFTNHYSYYNGVGSTFNSEFAVNTGFITPLSFTQNAYSFSKSTFPYTLARLFKNEGYAVNAFHMNTSEFYSRGANYKNWGYDNYYGLIDLYDYKNKEYELDRELILNEDFSNKMFENDKFVDYIITYSSHLPFSTEKGVCKTLITMDALEELGEEKLPKDYTLPVLTEEECAKRQAKETDYMVELLLNKLEEKSLLENTVIVVYTDHYLYTLSDQTILDKYKDTKNNLINHTPFFIYDGKTKKTVKDVTSQLNILPTVLNLYGIDYNPVNYLGKNALAKNYNGYVFFSDYSWYDGNVYVEGGVVTNNKWISSDALENMNYYIGEIIKKNDITLKTDYFKKITTLKENTQNNEEETEEN